MRKRKTDQQLKEAFWARHFDMSDHRELKAYERVVNDIDRPTCASEAVFILRERMLDLVSLLPFIGRMVR